MSAPKLITMGPPNEPWERTQAGRIALGRATGAEEGVLLLDALGIEPAACRRSAEPVRRAS